MKQILEEIQSGQFAREFVAENQTGRSSHEDAARARCHAHPIEVGRRGAARR